MYFVISQELYEYILSTGHIDGSCFTLSQCFPRHELLPTDARWDGSSEVITVEINDDSPDLLQLFEDSLVSSYVMDTTKYPCSFKFLLTL